MTDTTALARGLEAYIATLERHLGRLREHRATLDMSWGALNGVYHGNGADVFRQAFERAREMMNTYTSSGEAILVVMRDRVEALRRFDAPDVPTI